jgi:hypothetical protein
MESRKYTQEEITEMERQAEERSEAISRALYEFNRMLQRREKPREECYMYLFEKQREIEDKYGVNTSFSFLYPEWIFEVEDTYELNKQKMKEWSEQYKSYRDEISKLQK